MAKILIVVILVFPFAAYATEDGGWTRTNCSVNYGGCFADGSGTTLYAAWPDGFGISSDNGITWTNFSQQLSPTCLMADNATLYAGTRSGMFRSNDTAKTWSLIGNGLPQERAYSLTKCADNMVAVMESGIYTSTDGTNWLLTYARTPVPSYSRLKVKGDTIYWSVAKGLLVSGDRGLNWDLVDSTHQFYMAVPGDSWLFASSEAEGILRSGDGGHTWQIVNKPTDAPDFAITTYHNSVFASEAGAAATGTFFSSDGGETWRRVNGEQPHRLYGLFVSGPNLLAVSSNVALWYRPLADILQSLSVEEEKTASGFTLFPNPFCDKITIGFPTSIPDAISIVDVLGREVERLYPEHSESIHSISWAPASSVAAGYYYGIAYDGAGKRIATRMLRK